MRNRLLAFTLALCMVFTTLPLPASAQESAVTITVAGTQNYDYAREVVELTNAERSAESLSTLEHNATLSQLAMQRAAEVAVLFHPNHLRPDNTEPQTITEGVYAYFYFGENIAAGQETPAEVVSAWMNSEGHRTNIMSANYTQIGVGCFYADGYYCWVQLFGQPQTGGNQVPSETGTRSVQTTMSAAPSNLNLSPTGARSVTLDPGGTTTVSITTTNPNVTSLSPTLVPIVSDAVDAEGNTIATATVAANGTVTVTAVNPGSASMPLPVYTGQSEPYTLNITVSAPVHSHSYTSVTTSATCTEDGLTTYTCSCGDTYTEAIPATGHAWDDGVVTTPATETDAGIMTYTCTVCGGTETETIPAIGHEHSYTSVTTAPTCTEDGFTTYTCECGDSYTADTVSATGHSWGDWVTITEPTTEAEGSEQRTCQACGETETRSIDKLPSSGEDGHQHNVVIENAKDATCYENGYTGDQVCTTCGEVIQEGETIQAGHIYGDWVVYDYPDGPGDGGDKRQECTICGHTVHTGVTSPEDPHPDGYPVTVTHNSDGTMGTVWLTITQAKPGHEVFLTVSPDAGYYMEALYYYTTAETVEEPRFYKTHDELYAFTMPEGELFIDVVFAPEPAHNVYLYQNNGGTASVSEDTVMNGDTFTLTVVPDKGYAVDAIYYAYYGYDEPDIVQISDTEWEFTMRDGDIEIDVRFITTINPFVDVSQSAFYYKPVLWAVTNGITTGIDATHFAPKRQCTREEIVTFLWRAAGKPEPQTTVNPFSDVPAGSYYEKAVLWAYENGITTGTGNGRFSPKKTCTRAEVVTFLWRTCGMPNPSSYDNPFSDVPANSYYTDAVLWAVEWGITTGTGNGKFSPAAVCTRGEIVTFLYRTF